MTDMIKDGKGRGNLAGVGSSNRLDCSVRQNERIYYASRDENGAYTVQFHVSMTAGGTAEGIGFITNTGTNRINIKEISLSTEEPATQVTKFGIWRKPTVSGGTTRAPVNLNFGSNNTPDATISEATNAGTVTISGGTSLYTIRMQGIGTKIIDLHDAVILGTNDTIGILANAATTGTKCIANVMFDIQVD